MNNNAKEIFLKVSPLDAEERPAVLDAECGDNDKLRRRVEALLAAHDDPESYLERPAARFDVTATTDGNGRGSGLSDSSSSHHGRFLPGTRVADRYRIVSLLGRGGMGEVYRADDLRLGQTVALKFLPPELAKDAKRLEYFHNEVKLARQISHPNVCRVYDIGEVDGQHFISMEYIDGEDLKTLLHRIGRLPKDKGIQIAQQLCSGLAAAHAKGVLHRDLKPANIMIDGQGQARITDFGLATMSIDGENVIGMSGTPAYMAPEQLLRGQTSIQSDIYSLGLIVFEVFAGKTAYQASSIEELKRVHEESSIVKSLSDVIDDCDPVVERAVRKCLSPDPTNRPHSVGELAASLPGGDPLAAALARGETPSPALVAAVEDSDLFTVRASTTCLVALIVLLAVTVGIAQFIRRENLVLKKSPAVLEDAAQQIIEHLGYATTQYRASGFVTTNAPARSSDVEQAGAPSMTKLSSKYFNGISFWYRQSPGLMVINEVFSGPGQTTNSRIHETKPPWDKAGMIGVRLHSTGLLKRFRVIPPDQVDSLRTKNELKWDEWFTESMTGLKLSELSQTEMLRTPPDAFDHVQAWDATWPTGEPLHIVAASYGGRPTYFEVFRRAEVASPRNVKRGDYSAIGWLVIIVEIGAVVLAYRHVVLRRGDKRGAWRIAIFAATMNMVIWILSADHVLDPFERNAFIIGVGGALAAGLEIWMLYVALEPIVRRCWPDLLVSWTRILDGRVGNRRLGRDLLVGAMTGCLLRIDYDLLRLSIGRPYSVQGSVQGYSLLGFNDLVAVLATNLLQGISYGLFFLCLVTFVSSVARSKSTTFVISVVVLSSSLSLAEGFPMFAWPIRAIGFAIVILTLMRFGLLAAVTAESVAEMLSTPLTTDTMAFYFSNGMFTVLVVMAIGAYGYYISVGQKLPRFLRG